MSKINKSKARTKSPTPAAKSVRKPARKAAKSAAATPAAAAGPELQERAPVAPVFTTVTVLCDVGFGNALYIRGEGPGLSWDKGVLMNCIGPEEWQIQLGESARPFAYKILVNDISWSAGPDFMIEPGASQTISPQF